MQSSVFCPPIKLFEFKLISRESKMGLCVACIKKLILTYET